MQIYFGQDHDCHSDEQAAFFHKDEYTEETTRFYYGVEYGSGNSGLEDVLIYDACGRSVPINLDHIPELIMALEKVLEISDQLASYQELKQQLYDPLFETAIEQPV